MFWGEVRRYLDVLHGIKSGTVGGPGSLEIVAPPYRAMRFMGNDTWPLNVRASDDAEYVVCQNDLSQSNITVGPDTLKIQAIID